MKKHLMISKIDDQLMVFRDDVYPFLGGGNKGRKIKSIERRILQEGCNAVVTTGGIQSNHCRALAILAAQNNWKCTLVLHGEKEAFDNPTGNALLMKLSGANLVFSEVTEISKNMDAAMDSYKEMDLKPFYVWGGGHTMEGGYAYIEVIEELKRYSENQKWQPDYIFLASGTGSTQAGILAGLDKYNLDSKVIGISVGRKQEQAEKIVENFYQELCAHYSIEKKDNEVKVLDSYLCGGYEKYNEEILSLSENSLGRFGFLLDTTYSGKAFYGMQDYIKRNDINGNVLFWHTGGILNFLAK